MIAAVQAPGKGDKAADRARALFMAVTVAGLLLLALLPAKVITKLGLADGSFWFLDTYAILASNDAVQAGLDPSQPNPLDVFGRPHSYSGWWFALGRLGLTREDNALVGGLVTGLFALAVLLYVKPRTLAQAGMGALAVLAPVVLLAFNRANNDLVVFTLLVAGLLVLREGSPVRTAVFGVAVVLATGLKFYPLIAGVALLTLAPARLRGWATAGTLLVAAAVLASQWAWLQRAVFPVSEGIYLFGAGLWWRELGLTGWVPAAVTALLLAVGAGWLVRRDWCLGLTDASFPVRERAGFVAGAVLLVGCWLAGISFAYRWVFALLLLPWLWRRGADRSARLTGGLLLACLWLDGLFCLATNLFIGPMTLERLRAVQHGYLLVAQPVNAALMLLLSGWLWGLLIVRIRAWWPAGWPLRPVSPRWLMLCVLLGWLAYVQSDRLRLAVGLPNSETWFLDSYAVLAASDAHHAGLDAAAAGHFDPLGRPHRYSDWWYGLGSLGLTRDDNFLFGLGCVVAAAAALVVTVRPTNVRLLGWSLLVLLSPEVFLGFNRANNDLVVFALFGAALVALRGHRGWQHAVAGGAIALAAGLKFYPVVAALPLFWHHARSGRWKTAWISVGIIGLALLSVWPQMARGRFPLEVSVHVWGAGIWPQDLGWGRGGFVALLLIALAGATVLAFRGAGNWRRDPEDNRSSLPMLLAATLLVACFAAGLNYGYRWIFAIWLGPWLFQRGEDGTLPWWPRALAWLGLILVPLVLWLDGLLCLSVNTGGLVAADMDYARLQLGWRLLTQPLHWLLMGLLLGWLLEAAKDLANYWRDAPHKAA